MAINLLNYVQNALLVAKQAEVRQIALQCTIQTFFPPLFLTMNIDAGPNQLVISELIGSGVKQNGPP